VSLILMKYTSSPRSDVAMRFSHFSAQQSIRMVHVKNYETMSRFVKVMPRIL